jgi:transposase-like protein
VPQKRRKFSPEFKDEAVKAVIMNSRPIAQVAREIGVNEGTLGNWVATYRRDHADEEPGRCAKSFLLVSGCLTDSQLVGAGGRVASCAE